MARTVTEPKNETKPQPEVESAAPNSEVDEPSKAVAEGGKAPEKPKSKRFEPPEGFVTPSAFVHVLAEERNTEVKPQQIYGYCKNNKQWGEITKTEPTYHFPKDKALELWDAKETRAKEKAAAAAKAEEAKKSEGENTNDENADS
jgi:hypothetical protein